MQKVVEFLQKNPVQYLATVGRDGKAKCRPFMFGFEQDGKLCSSGIAALYRALWYCEKQGVFCNDYQCGPSVL